VLCCATAFLESCILPSIDASPRRASCRWLPTCSATAKATRPEPTNTIHNRHLGRRPRGPSRLAQFSDRHYRRPRLGPASPGKRPACVPTVFAPSPASSSVSASQPAAHQRRSAHAERSYSIICISRNPASPRPSFERIRERPCAPCSIVSARWYCLHSIALRQAVGRGEPRGGGPMFHGNGVLLLVSGAGDASAWLTNGPEFYACEFSATVFARPPHFIAYRPQLGAAGDFRRVKVTVPPSLLSPEDARQVSPSPAWTISRPLQTISSGPARRQECLPCCAATDSAGAPDRGHPSIIEFRVRSLPAEATSENGFRRNRDQSTGDRWPPAPHPTQERALRLAPREDWLAQHTEEVIDSHPYRPHRPQSPLGPRGLLI